MLKSFSNCIECSLIPFDFSYCIRLPLFTKTCPRTYLEEFFENGNVTLCPISQKMSPPREIPKFRGPMPSKEKFLTESGPPMKYRSRIQDFPFKE